MVTGAGAAVALEAEPPDPCGAPTAPLERLHAVTLSCRRRRAERDSWVITHGEPHWRNVLSGADGLHVVDWDTALLAPAARDLWHVAGAEGVLADEVLAGYAALTGRAVTTHGLLAQALRRELTEVALYAAWFARPHLDDADGEIAWGGFTESLSSVGARPSAA